MTRLFTVPCLLFVLLLAVPALVAQGQENIPGVTAQGSAGVTLTMEELQKLSDAMPQPTRIKIREELPTNRKPRISPASPVISSYSSVPTPFTDPTQHATQELHSNFLGITLSESGSVPPDCMGSVGPTQICVASNGRIKFYAKPSVCDAPLSTSSISGSTPLANPIFSVGLDAFFSSVRNNSETTDPHVHYDRLSGRWFVVCINIESTSNRILVAVSNGPTITNTSSFTFYFFNHDAGVTVGQSDYHQFCDFPMPGLDKYALYIGGLIFSSGGGFQGSSIYVVNKASLISGGPLTFTAFRRVGTSGTGIFAPQGVDNDDPDATRGYFLGVDAANYGVLNYIVISDPGGVPTRTSGSLNVPLTSAPLNQIAAGSTNDLDGADDRLLNVQMMKNKTTGVSTIWTAHNISVNSSGVASAPDRNAVRWYELNVPGPSLSLKQSGTWYDNASVSPRGYWMGSIAMSGQGHAVAGASAAGAEARANVVASGRYNGQTLGALSNTANITLYGLNYNAESDEPQRWGDYSVTEVDPSDNMTLWTFQEFTAATNVWGVRVTQFKAPPPATPTNMTQVICNATRSLEVTLTGTSVDNSGFFDPGNDANGPGFAKRLSVTSTGGVTISNVIFDNPTQIRFTLNYAEAVLGSALTLTVTNPDCQTVSFNYTLPTGCAPLPVNWLGVTAVWVNDEAKVDWKVANEVNNLSYEVERSFDGRSFAGIGKLPAGNSNSASYTFTDGKAGDVNFYRIKQTDKDGSTSYSTIVVLTRKSINRMSVFPNPATEHIHLLLPAATGQVRLLDLSGKLVLTENVITNYVSLPAAKLARGVYVVEYVRDGVTETERVVLK